MKKPMRPGGASPGYGSPGYGAPPGGPGDDKRSGHDMDARSSSDFGSAMPRGRRGPGAGRKRPVGGGGGFGDDYEEGFHGRDDHGDRGGGY